jgi:hypothetical protein
MIWNQALLRSVRHLTRALDGARQGRTPSPAFPSIPFRRKPLLEALEPRVLMSADVVQLIQAGSEVRGSVSAAGETDRYGFELTDAKRLYLDALTDSAVNWTLTGPTGVVVDQRSLRATDAQDRGDSPVIALDAGNYVLSIDGTGDVVSDYGFRLVDLAQVGTLTPGVNVTGQLDPATETDAYRFEVQAGERFFFDMKSASGSNAQWRLIDPLGEQVFANNITTDVDVVTLGSAGIYTLLVEGRRTQVTPITYEFNVQKVVDDVAALTLGASTAGTIAHAGQQDHYTFALAQRSRLVFDALANTGLNWSLAGPNGSVVTSRAFNGSDANHVGGTNPVLDLVAGDYRLTVDAAGDATGSYAFRMLDLASAPVITPQPAGGTPVTDTLDPGALTRTYAIDATAGDRFFFDRQSQTAGTAWWRLIDPYGGQIFGTGFTNDQGNLTLLAGGRYTLLVEGSVTNATPVTYSFNVERRGNLAAELAIGITDEFDGALGADWQIGNAPRDGFAYLGAPTYRFETLDGASVVRLSNTLSNNQRVGWTSNDVIASTSGFRYEVRLNTLTQGSTTGIDGLLEVALVDEADPGRFIAASLFGAANGTDRHFYSNSPGSGGFVDRPYAFQDNTWYRIVLEGSPTQAITASLLSDGGAVLATRTFSTSTDTFASDFRVGLFQNMGTPNRPAPTDVAIDYARVTSTPIVTTPLVFDSLVAGNRAAATQRDTYTFTLAAETVVYFDSRTNDNGFRWTLKGPQGVVVADRGFAQSDAQDGRPWYRLVAGTYTVTVAGTSTGAYGFKLGNFANGAFITPGVPVDGTLSPGNETDIYRFDAQAGERFYFDMQSVQNADAWWRLIDPNGDEVWFANLGTDGEPAALTIGGTYTLMLDGRRYNTAPNAYRFNVVPAIDTTRALVPGTGQGTGPYRAPGSIGNGIEFADLDLVEVPHGASTDLTGSMTVEFSFRADGFLDTWTALVYKGMPQENGGNDWQQRTYAVFLNADGRILLSSGGQEASSVAGTIRAGQWYHVAGVIDRTTGQMRLLVDGNQVASGAARTTAATSYDTPLRIGRSLSAWDDHAGLFGAIDEVRLWNRARTTDEIRADRGVALAGNETGLALYLPFSEASGATTTSTNGITATLRNLASNLGGVVQGRILSAGSRDIYTFTLDATTSLYFDSLTKSGLTWTLTGPRGLVVNARQFQFSNSNDIGGTNPVMRLVAGSYTLTVDAPGDAVGAYAFRLHDVAVATTIAPGVAVTGELNPGRATQFYRFDATAGDHMYFDLQSVANGDAYWRLIDPAGNQVFTAGLGGDVDIASLTRTGTYTLLVEGRRYNIEPNAYRFTVQKVIDETVPIVIGQSVGVGPDRVAGSIGNGLAFGDLDYVEVPNGAATDLAGSMTVEFSFRVDEFVDTWTALVYKGMPQESAGNDWQQRTCAVWLNADGRILLSSGGQEAIAVAGTIRTGQWYHVAGVIDRAGGQMRLIVDGTQVATGAARATAAPSYATPLLIGRSLSAYDDNAGLSGAIDEVRLWNRARTIDEIRADRGVSLTGTESGLALYLPFSETVGSTTTASNGITGTLRSVADGLAGVVQGRIDQPGARDLYTFTLDAPRRLYLDSLVDTNIHWTLRGPRGVVVSARELRSSNANDIGGTSPVLDLVAGSYTLVIDVAGDQTGPYAFRLIDLADATSIVPGATVSGELRPGNATVAYQFEAAAGSRFHFDMQSVANADAYWRLIDPAGGQIFAGSLGTDMELPAFGLTGTYTLLVEGRRYNTEPNAFRFVVTPIVDDVRAITPGVSSGDGPAWTSGVQGGAITLTGTNWLEAGHGAATNLTRDLTLETWIRVDRFANTWMPVAVKESGTSFNQRGYSLWVRDNGAIWFGTSDASGNQNIETAGGQIVAGEWAHLAGVIDRSGSGGTGSQLRLYLNGTLIGTTGVRDTTALSFDTPLSIGRTIENNGSYAQFEGTIDEFRLWNFARTQAQIQATKDATLAGSEAGLSLHLPLDETSGREIDDRAAGNTSVRWKSFDDLAPGGVYGEIASAGQRDIYTFTLAADARLYLDSLYRSDLPWSLTGPRGTVVSNRAFNASNAQDFGGGRVVLDLVAGDYTLTIDPAADATGRYAFRLMDLAGATVITPDVPVSVALDPGSSTRMFRFEAAAGERFYFDARTAGTTDAVWRLVGPQGEQVFYGNIATDIPVTTLPIAGTYTLILEGRYYNQGTNPFTFLVQRVVDITTALVPGQAQGADPDWTSGRIGGGITLDGTEFLEAANGAATNLTGNVTLETWLRVDRFADTWMAVAAKDEGGASTRRGYSLWVRSNGALWFGTNDSIGSQSIETTGGQVTAGQWAHVAGVIDRSAAIPQLRLYVNGALVGTTNLRPGTSGVSLEGPLSIGRTRESIGGETNFVGALDDFRLWNIVRTQPQIAAAKDAALAGNEAGLTLYLPLDQSAGKVVANAVSGSAAVQWRSLADAVPGAIVGRIDITGQRNIYTFSLTQRTSMLFDALNSSDFGWTLGGPLGNVVSGRRFDGSDAGGFGSPNLLDLIAGDYTLTIDPPADATGFYAFRLLDLATAIPVTRQAAIDPAVEGRLDAASATQLYAFDAAAGDRVFFDQRSQSGGSVYWRLLDPAGQQLFFRGFGDVAEMTLPVAGRYTLAIEGSAGNVGVVGFSFAVEARGNTPPAVVPDNDIAFAQLVAGTIAAAGEVDTYTFTLTEAKRIVFDARTDGFSFLWNLQGPRGLVTEQRFYNTDSGRRGEPNPVLQLEAGRYVLRIRNDANQTGAYAFQLADLAAASDLVTGTQTIGVLSPGQETDFHKFTAQGGERWYFNLQQVDNADAVWRLIGPLGQQVAWNSLGTGNDIETTLPQSGTYVLMVEGQVYNAAANNYRFTAQKIVDVAAALPIGATVNGSIAMAGQRDTYSFTLGQRTKLVFDTLTDANLNWTLTGPLGTVVGDRSFRGADANDFGGNPLLDLAAGDYTLVVDATTDITSTYAFRLLDLANATMLTTGTARSDTLSPGTQTLAYRFEAQAGDHLYFDMQASLPDGQWRLISPHGDLVFSEHVGSDVDLDPARLTATGTYTLLIEGRRNAGAASSNTVRFNVQRVADDSAALAFGETINGAIAHAGQQDIHTFMLGARSRIYFDALANTGLTWTLAGPRGTVVAARSFQSSDSSDNGGSAVLDLVAGSYTLTVDASGDQTGSYAFRLLDFASAASITPGSPQTGQLLPGNATALYRFDAAAGDRFFFDMQSVSDGNGQWRLVDPYGDQVFNVNLGTDPDTEPFTLANAGTYTLLIEGRRSSTATNTFRFNVTPAPLAAPTPLDGIQAQPGPDLVADGVTVAGTLESGQVLTISWTDRNAGNVAAESSWRDRVIVRNAVSGEIVANVLVPVTIGGAQGPLVPGASHARQVQVTLPEGLRGTGAFDVVVGVDIDNALAEQNATRTGESNNESVVGITTTLASYADLVVGSLAIDPPAAWAAGASVTLSWRLDNTGTRAVSTAFADTVQVRNVSTGQVVFSGTAAYDPTVDGDIAAGAGRDRHITFTWPASGAEGLFEFTVSADGGATVFESNATSTGESNNSARMTVASAPDLVVTNLRLDPATIESGAQLVLRWDDSNTGNRPVTASWRDRIEIVNTRTGETLLTSDLLHDSTAGGDGPLAAGAGHARAFTFRLPDGVRGFGTLRITVTSDRNVAGSGTVLEANAGSDAESNNSASLTVDSALRTYADLRVVDFVAPPTARGGDPVTLSWSVSNDGPVAATGTWIDRVVLSQDTILGNADDRIVAEVTRTLGLAAGATYDVSTPVTLPLQLEGGFNLFLRTDAGNAVVEPDTRTNNTVGPRAVALATPYADLATEAVSAPATAPSGSRVEVAWRVRNGGDTEIPATATWKDRLYLSRDGVVDATDVVLGDVVRNGPLAVGATYSGRTTVSLPNEISGDWRILVASDVEGQIFERGLEANNIAATLTPILVTVAPTPNLVASDVTAPPTVLAGGIATVEWTVTNAGEADATGPWVDRIYLSVDGTTTGATLLKSVTRTDPLAVGANYRGTTTVTLPSVADANFRIVVVTDGAGQVFESRRESDNASAGGVLAIVHHDLGVEPITAASTATSAGSLRVQWRVVNVGSAPLPQSWIDRVYLSRDDRVDASDRLLAERTAGGPLAVGDGYDRDVTTTLPVDVSGNWFVLVATDAAGAVAEFDAETNNVRASAISIDLAPYADLAVSNVTAPALTIADPAWVTVGWTVTNTGTGAGLTGTWTDRVIASRNAVVGDSDDIVLGEFEHVTGLARGDSYVRSEMLLMTPRFEGRYHLFVQTDAQRGVFQNGALANDAAEAPNFFDVMPIPYANLQVASASVEPTAQSGGTVRVFWRVENHGIAATNANTWSDSVALTSDPAGLVVVAGASFDHLGVLAPETGYDRFGDVAIPDGFTGTLYAFVRTGGPFEFIYTGDNSRRADGSVAVALAPSADLIATDIVAPTAAGEGETITVTWTVLNQGAAAAPEGWADTVQMRRLGDPEARPITLGSFRREVPLAAGQSYTRTELIRMPDRLDGSWRIEVVTNSNRSVYEHAAAAGNNLLGDDTALTLSLRPRSDLQVENVSVPTVVAAGGTITVSFDIVNRGSVATTTPRWKDYVWLSTDPTLGGGDILLGTVDNSEALDPEERYRSVSAQFQVPIRYAGTGYIIVQANGDGAVDEFGRADNNALARAIEVTAYPPADLVTGTVVVPSQGVYGTEIEVRYTVTNNGSNITDRDTWTDGIWLTRDRTRPNAGGNSAIFLGSVQHTGRLAVGESYTVTAKVRIPKQIESGTYYITPWADTYGTLIESTFANNQNPDDPNEANSNNYKARAIDIIGTPVMPPPDLRVVEVVADATGSVDGPFTVRWTVMNDAEGDALEGDWYDGVFVHDLPTLDAPGGKTWFLGRFQKPKNLASGESYTLEKSVRSLASAERRLRHGRDEHRSAALHRRRRTARQLRHDDDRHPGARSRPAGHERRRRTARRLGREDRRQLDRPQCRRRCVVGHAVVGGCRLHLAGPRPPDRSRDAARQLRARQRRRTRAQRGLHRVARGDAAPRHRGAVLPARRDGLGTRPAVPGRRGHRRRELPVLRALPRPRVRDAGARQQPGGRQPAGRVPRAQPRRVVARRAAGGRTVRHHDRSAVHRDEHRHARHPRRLLDRSRLPVARCLARHPRSAGRAVRAQHVRAARHRRVVHAHGQRRDSGRHRGRVVPDRLRRLQRGGRVNGLPSPTEAGTVGLSSDHVQEFRDEGDNITVRSLPVVLRDAADLQVASVTIPERVLVGGDDRPRRGASRTAGPARRRHRRRPGRITSTSRPTSTSTRMRTAISVASRAAAASRPAPATTPADSSACRPGSPVRTTSSSSPIRPGPASTRPAAACSSSIRRTTTRRRRRSRC